MENKLANAHKAYTKISGGERQLVLIARVMTQQPKIILLGEPIAHLDYGNQHRTVQLIRQLADAINSNTLSDLYGLSI